MLYTHKIYVLPGMYKKDVRCLRLRVRDRAAKNTLQLDIFIAHLYNQGEQ